MNRCKDCGEKKPWDSFPRHKSMKSGHLNSCKDCVAVYQKLYYENNPQRDNHLKYKYGISELEWNAMFAQQDGRCAICRKDRKLHTDHDHNTGEVRGLLCQGCNLGLGHFEDDEVSLSNAIQYLQDSGKQIK